MVRRRSMLVALLGVDAGPACAQEVDARAALLASLKGMGGENLIGLARAAREFGAATRSIARGTSRAGASTPMVPCG